MSQTYGTIDSAMVTHPHFRALASGAKLLALYLRVCDRCNVIGAFYYPIPQIADDLDIPIEVASKGLQSLSARDFARYCETTRWVFIPKLMHRFPVVGVNRVKSALKYLDAIPRDFTYLPDVLQSFEENHNYGQERDATKIALCEQAWDGVRRGFGWGSNSSTTSSTTSTTIRAGARDPKTPPFNPLRDTSTDYSSVERPDRETVATNLDAARKALKGGAS